MATAQFWFAYIARSVWRGGRRSLFAVICVAVGVTGVVALQTASLTMQQALTSNVRAANGGDISVSSETTPLSAGDLAIFHRLKREGRVSSWTAVQSVHATTAGTHGDLVPFEVDIVSSPPYPLGGQPTFVTPAHGNVANLLNNHGNVLITSVLADELGVHVGSRLFVNAIGGKGLHAVVQGILSETSFSHSATMTVNERDAPLLATGRPRYTAVYANTSQPVNDTAASLRAAFPTATVQTVAEALQSAKQQVHDFQQFLLLVGLLALLIAGIGTLNAMQSMLARRRLEIAMLKAIGFGQVTLYALFGGEALLIGIGGGLAGTFIGAVMSKVITQTLARALGVQVTFVLDGPTLLAGIALGVGAALVFAVLPIVRAAAYRPLEILRESMPAASAHALLQTVILLGVLLVLFAALAGVILNDFTLAGQFVVGAFLLCGLLAALFALIVSWLGRLGRPRSPQIGIAVLLLDLGLTVAAALREPALAAIGALITLLWLATMLLPDTRLLTLLIAARSLSRRRARTSVTLVAFLAGVLSMTVTLTVALTLHRQIADTLASRSATNLVAASTLQGEQSIRRASARLPGIKRRTDVIVVQTQPVAINGRSLVSVIGPSPVNTGDDPENDRGRYLRGFTGWNLAGGQLPPDIRIVIGRALTRADADTNNVLLEGDLLAGPYNLSIDDEVEVRDTGSTKARSMHVVGFYEPDRRRRGFSSFFTPPIYGDRSFGIALAGSDAESVWSFSIDPNQLTHDATTLQRDVPGALVVDIGDLTGILDTILNELLDVLIVITSLVLGAGVAVVANGVALAMLERRREVALYKAIGFSPGSVAQFVLTENALIGMLAGTTSILATAVFLRLFSHFALQTAIGFDPLVAVAVLSVAILLAVLTAYLTARSPIRIRPIEALRNE